MNLMSSFKSFMRFEELSTYYSVSSNFLCSHIEQKYPHFLHNYVPSFSSFWLFFFFGLDTCSHYFQHNIEFCLYCSEWFQKQRGYQNKFSNFTYKITNDEVFPLGSNLTFTYCFKLNRIWTASLIPLLKESWNSYCAVKIKFKVLSTLTLKLRYANTKRYM